MLGSGGQGTVCLAVSTLNGRQVAFKQVAIIEANDVERLKKEALLHEAITHQHVVKLLDYFHLSELNEFCLVTELCDRGDLNTLIVTPPTWVDLDVVRCLICSCLVHVSLTVLIVCFRDSVRYSIKWHWACKFCMRAILSIVM